MKAPGNNIFATLIAYMSDISLESDFRFLADAVPVKVWRANASMQANYYNQEWYEYTGAKSMEELRDAIWSLIHPDDLSFVRLAAQTNLSRSTSYEIEHRFKDKNGNYRWHLSRTKPVLDEKGQLKSWLGICMDIEDQKQSIENLSRNEKYFRFLADNTPIIIWRTGLDGRLNYISKQWESFSGMTVSQAFNLGWRVILHPDDVPSFEHVYQDSLISKSDLSCRFRMRRQDGSFCWFLSVGVSVFDGETGHLGTLTDITDQENEHQQSNMQLKKMDEFVSIASHELKTPLTSLKLYLQLIEKDKIPQQAQFLSRGLEQLKRLERLTSDLLDVSKISAGKLAYNIEDVELGELFDDCTQIIESWNVRHQLTIKNKPSIKIQADRHRLEQVFSNILSNAVKYSPDADRIILDSYIQNNFIVISIQDFGIGIAQPDLARIFQRFYRVDATAMKYEGLGLGLFIVSEILIRHNGDFWIESEPGKGSVFYFKLPLKETKRTILTDTHGEYRDDYMSIVYNKKDHLLEVDWLGFQDFESVKYGCLKIHELLKANNCKLVLNDNTHITGVSDAAEWVGGYWFPMMEASGLKYFAWVFSAVMFNNISAQKAVDLKQGNVVTQFFTSSGEAREWLLASPLE